MIIRTRTLFSVMTLVGIGLLCLVPKPYKVTSGILDNHGDHAIAYATASLVLCMLYGRDLGGRTITLLLFGFAALCEGLQAYSPGRTPTLGDLASSCVGILLGVCLYAIAVQCRRNEIALP